MWKKAKYKTHKIAAKFEFHTDLMNTHAGSTMIRILLGNPGFSFSNYYYYYFFCKPEMRMMRGPQSKLNSRRAVRLNSRCFT